ATHVHHTLPVLVLMPSVGSPISTVAPTLDPVAVSAPLPTTGRRFAKLSLEARTLYVKPLVNVPDWLSMSVTMTFTGPAACAGVVAVIAVDVRTVTFVAATPPIDTVDPTVNPVPAIVTAVPPVVGPDAAAIDRTVGGAGITLYVKAFGKVPETAPRLV